MNRPGLVEALKRRKGGAVPAPRKYPEELRKRAIRLAVDLVHGEPAFSMTAACRRVGEQLGINADTLRNWVQQAMIDSGHRPGVSTDDRQRVAELEREVRGLRRANAILMGTSVPGHSLHQTPRRSRRGSLGGQRGRLLRL
jgi:transposase